MKSTLEDQLLSNSMPYPQYFDGVKWNTIVINSRKHIPSYLKESLPKRKFHSVKSKFQEMNRFAPPEIGYFQKIINKTKPKKSFRDRKQRVLTKADKILSQIKCVREEMQYALIMSSRESNVLVKLMQRSQKLQKMASSIEFNPQKTFKQKLLQTKISRSRKLGQSTKSYFNNTDDVVFSFRKKQCIDRTKSVTSVILPSEEEQRRIDSIRLRTFTQERSSTTR